MEQYFDPTAGIVKRARRTLIDKKLRVAEAGYFTRKLVEFLGSIRVREDLQDYVLHEIDLNKLLYKRTLNGGNDVRLCNVFGKSRFIYRWILTDDGRTILSIMKTRYQIISGFTHQKLFHTTTTLTLLAQNGVEKIFQSS